MLWDSNQHVHQVSSNSERVWRKMLFLLGDLTRNDPHIETTCTLCPLYSVKDEVHFHWRWKDLHS